MEDEEERRHVNIWSDMEKCIFLDRFLHHPKDFRKIASFLKNKTTKDCIKFYYDSKKTVPYKHALKEFIHRKKKRGDVVSWDATIQACLATGAVIKAGSSSEKPLKFVLPESDYTYHTINFHPLRLEVFEDLEVIVSHSKHSDDTRSHNKRKRSNWFILDHHAKKYLKNDDDHNHHSSKRKSATEESIAASAVEEDAPSESEDEEPKKATTSRKKAGKESKKQQSASKPQKWKEKEKSLFFDALDKHGESLLFIE